MSSESNDSDSFEKVVDWVQNSEKTVIFSGAGLSAASGISTFRDEEGFWKRFPPDQFANWKGLIQTTLLQPQLMADFLIAVLEPVCMAKPNAAHEAIAKLNHYNQLTVITQNIDRLHQAAGNEKVYEIHGSLFEIIQYPDGEIKTILSREDLRNIVNDLQQAKEQFWSGPKLLKAIYPIFGPSWNSFHRPNIILFGDQLKEPDWSDAQHVVQQCDLLISIGTSQSVYPAASLPEVAKENGAKVIVIDPQVGGGDIWLQEKAEVILPHIVDAVMHRGDNANG